MTKDEALKKVIENLEIQDYNNVNATLISYCKEALEQPAQEPVAWRHLYESGYDLYTENDDICPECEPLYTHPHQWQEPVAFTASELEKIIYNWTHYDSIDFEGMAMELNKSIEDKNK